MPSLIWTTKIPHTGNTESLDLCWWEHQYALLTEVSSSDILLRDWIGPEGCFSENYMYILNRPGVAGAFLKIPSWLISLLTQSVILRLKFDLAPYLKSSFLEKYPFLEKKLQEKWQNKAHIYIRQYVKIEIFENSDLKQVFI